MSPSHRIALWIRQALVALLLLVFFGAGLGYLTVRHVLWPQAPRLLPQLVQAASEALGQPLSIGAARTRWEGLHPAFTLEDVRLGAPAQALALPRVDAVLSWRSLLLGAPRFARLRLVGVQADAVRQDDGAWRIGGVRVAPGAGADRSELRWLLRQRRLELVDARLSITDAHGQGVVLEGVSAVLDNAGRAHRFAIDAARLGQPDEPGGPARVPVVERLALKGDFVHPPHGAPTAVEHWRGSAYATAARLDAAALLSRLGAMGWPVDAHLPKALRPRSGTLAVQAWMDTADGRPVEAVLKIGATDLQLVPATDPLRLSRLRVDLRLARTDDGFLAQLPEADAVEAGGARWALADSPARLRLGPDGRLRELSMRAAALDVAATLGLARRLPLPASLAARLIAIDAAGQLQSLQIDWSAPGPGVTHGDWRVATRFDRLSLAAREPAPGAAPGAPGMPGFSGLSGRIVATRAGGDLALESQRATLKFPGLFTEPAIPLSRLTGVVKWTSSTDGVPQTVEAPRLAFANADAAAQLTGTWRRAPVGPGVLDLTGHLLDADATRTARYLPRNLPQPVRDWVAQAVLAGRGERVDFRVRGDLHRFPFRDPGVGEFRVATRLRGGVLRYAPDWPAIGAIDGEMVFDRTGMSVRADAQTHDLRLTGVQATIADFADPVLRIEGAGTGAAQDMLRFVADSPVRTMTDDLAADATATGQAALDLQLQLPLRDLSASRVQGSLRLAGNTLALDRTSPRFEDVAGRLAFTESGFSLHDLQATFLGDPIRVTGRTTEPGRMKIRGEGIMSAEGLRGLSDNAITRRLSGRLRYVATLDASRHAASARIESDLVGLGADLPAPFGKAPDAAVALQIDSVPLPRTGGRPRPDGDLVSAQLGPLVRAALERRRGTDDRMRVHRGAFAIDGEPVLPDEGLAVRVNMPVLDLGAWHALLGAVDAAGAPSTSNAASGSEAANGDASIAGLTLLPSTVSVVADRLLVAGKDLHTVVVGATRTGDVWRANVSSREIEGFFNWREAGAGQPIGTLTARFARLVIPRSRAGEVESILDSPPERLPGLDIAADEFVLGERSLGSLALRAVNGGTAANPVWRIERFALQSPEARFEATGRWARRPGARARSTELDFDLALNDSGALLARLGLRDAIRDGEGGLSGRIGWQGSPLSIDYPTLDGQVRLGVGGGQFLKVDPGLAKLVGVLSLQSLPRRLTLDFRDLFSDGFAFDRIDGDVRIERGVAHTDNLRMRGVQAVVNIRGQADLANETQSLHVRVVPEINAGLASLAYAALANPVIGLGSFVAQWAMRGPLRRAFAYDVDIEGPWAEPVVKPQARTDRSVMTIPQETSPQ